MSFRGLFSKIVMVSAFVLAAMGLPWGEGTLRAQISGTGTGWCSDYEGNNFRCSDGGGGYSGGSGSGGGYGGCASTSVSQANNDRGTANSMIVGGDAAVERGDYAYAADFYALAHAADPSYDRARRAHGSALNELGLSAYERYEYASALLYFERAFDVKPESDVIRDNLASAQARVATKSCSVCGRAVVNDVAYGLDISAKLKSYVHQATTNYANCTRRLSCGGSEGHQFFTLIRETCMVTFKYDEPGFRGCVSQAVSQYR